MNNPIKHQWLSHVVCLTGLAEYLLKSQYCRILGQLKISQNLLSQELEDMYFAKNHNFSPDFISLFYINSEFLCHNLQELRRLGYVRTAICSCAGGDAQLQGTTDRTKSVILL